MKKNILILLTVFSIVSSAQQSNNPVLDIFQNTQFYNLLDSANTKLIIFLHGGVTNPHFEESKEHITFNYITEDNDRFVKQASQNGFDLITPITNIKMNWLNEPIKSLETIQAYISTIPKKYEEIYISGFSDGGTASYKMFYTSPDYFAGLLVFNGFPQYSNNHRGINYSSVTAKKIIYYGTLNDKRMPYEFLLAVYCDQKIANSNTYLYVVDGAHSFNTYDENDIKELFLILNGTVHNNETVALHGFVKNDQLISIYPYRKKIIRKYGFGQKVYEENVKQLKQYGKLN